MSWWSKLTGRKPADPTPAQPGRRGAAWIAADQNRFGVPILDLISITGEMISTSREPAEAERAISWGRRFVADLELVAASAESRACALGYPTDGALADGWLYVPPAMEQKWAIAYRDQAIYLIRSWSGHVAAIGRTRREADRLLVERIELADNGLATFGDPVDTFDWIVRAHALGQVAPLPVDSEGAKLLEGVPLAVFGPFGNVARCAAIRWAPPPPERPLRTISDVVTAVRTEQPARLAALAAAGSPLDARSPVGGYTALHVAVIKGSVALTRQLLELGADPNALADRASAALITAIVHHAPVEVLDLLAAHGARVDTANADGFGMIHAIAETDRPAYLPWALAHGLGVEPRNKHGHTPLHIAAALGHVAALEALLRAGADRSARSHEGQTPREVAVAEGKTASIAALDRK